MPIYEYECCLCQFRFERKQRFDEEPVGTCPLCSGRARRVFHSLPVIFKGSGFYITDNRKVKEEEKATPKGEDKKEG